MGLSLAKIKQRIETGESYSNEQFESMAESKTLSGGLDNGAITCFVCKQQIPKSQALHHHKVCKKATAEKRDKKYSPIHEAEDDSDEEQYSSGKFEESGSSRLQNSSRKHSGRKGKKQAESSMVSNSGSVSTSNPAVNLFSKQVADFLRGGNDPINDEEDEEQSEADSDARPLPTSTTKKPSIQPKP